MKRLTILAVIALAPLAAMADVSGTWTATFDTQMLSGMAKSANGEVEIADGKIEGDTITFVENLNYQGMDLVITYTGTIVSDDEIEFTRDVSGIAMEELVAKRKVE